MVGTGQDSGVETECDGESNDSSLSRLFQTNTYYLIQLFFFFFNCMNSMSAGLIDYLVQEYD